MKVLVEFWSDDDLSIIRCSKPVKRLVVTNMIPATGMTIQIDYR